MKEKLVKFIKKNSLSFSGTGSDLNGSCTVICGYADHIGANIKSVKEAIEKTEVQVGLSIDQNDEINKVYEFASTYNYGKWWNSPEAIAQNEVKRTKSSERENVPLLDGVNFLMKLILRVICQRDILWQLCLQKDML